MAILTAPAKTRTLDPMMMRLFETAIPLTDARKEAIRKRMIRLSDELTTELLWPAVKAAHKANNFSDDDFARNLFITEGMGGKPIAIKDSKWLDGLDPYKQLDLKAWCTYLIFGGKRILNKQTGTRAKDQFYFFEFFNIGRYPEQKYIEVCDWIEIVLNQRNALEHENLSLLTLASLARYLYALTGILGSMQNDSFRGQCDRWQARLTKEFYASLGEVNYMVTAMMDCMAALQCPVPAGQELRFQRLMADAQLTVVGGMVAFTGNIVNFITKTLVLAWDQAAASWEDSVRYLRTADRGELPAPAQLTDDQKRRMIDTMENASPEFKELLLSLAREVHGAKGLQKAFEANLYISEGTGRYKDSHYANNAPLLDIQYKSQTSADSYKRLDLHGWIKYLRFGGCRIDPVTKTHVKDQDAIFDFLRIPYGYTNRDPWALTGDVAVHLKRLNDIRNNVTAHWSAVTVQQTTVQELMQWYEALRFFLIPMGRERWSRQRESQQLLTELDANLKRIMRTRTYHVEDMLEYMQIPESQHTEAKTLLDDLGFPVQDGNVTIEQDVQRFMQIFADALPFTRELRQIPTKVGISKRQTEAQTFMNRMTAKKDAPVLQWIEKAANAAVPSAPACYYIGCCCLMGRGKHMDRDEAAFWFRRAAKRGYAPAQVRLGQYYENLARFDRNVNPETAFEWYRKAADQYDLDGLYHLGRCYEKGIGTKRNDEESFQCYMDAGRMGHLAAWYEVGRCYERGRLDNPSASKYKAWEIFDELAAKDYPPAMRKQGGVRVFGPDGMFFQDYDLLIRAGECGEPAVYTDIARFYQSGMGGENQIDTAVKWLQKAAAYGDPQGMTMLAECYQSGNGVPKDEQKAVSLLEDAAEEGYAEAMKKLGYCYEHGIGIRADSAKARYWYQTAENSKNW